MRPVWTLDEILVPAAQMISLLMTVVIGVMAPTVRSLASMAMVRARAAGIGRQRTG